MLRCDHRRHDSLGAVVEAVEVVPDHALPLFEAHLGEGDHLRYARIGHKDVDPPPAILDPRCHGGHRICIGDVGGHRHGGAAGPLDLTGHRLAAIRVAAVDRDERAFGREEACRRRPDPGAGAGNERDAPFEAGPQALSRWSRTDTPTALWAAAASLPDRLYRSRQ